jgi:hypothetical protein
MTYTTPLADAIVAYLATLELPGMPTIARRRIVAVKLETAAGPQVYVIPWGPDLELIAAGVAGGEIEIRVVVQARIASSDGGDADTAAALAENIARNLLGQQILDVQCSKANMKPSYGPKEMAELGMYDATIFTTWRLDEDAIES